MVDTKEFELPETLFVRDIENRVFQGIVLQSLSKIPGISPIEGNFIDNILGRPEGVKGIHTEQDPKSHSISIKAEVNIAYGVSIPAKADEIQAKVTEEVTKMTGLHVSQVHVVFKGLMLPESPKKNTNPSTDAKQCCNKPVTVGKEYKDVF
jgi:uncharacterized alkaline shock family protein YloU